MSKRRTILSRLLILHIVIGSFLIISCDKDATSPPINENQVITIFYTNDEHGWMEQTSQNEDQEK